MARGGLGALGRVPRSQVVDFHVHAFPPEVRARRERFAALDAGFGALYSSPKARIATADEVLVELDAAGIDHAALVGFGWSDPAICRDHSQYLAEAARTQPDRLSALAAIQPGAAGAEAAVADAAALGLRGIGELMPHLQGYALDDDSVLRPVAEAAQALGLLILSHSSEPVGHVYPGKGNVHPESLLALARRWPALTIVAAHWGGGLPFYELMPEVAAATANLYYDTAASSLLYRPDVFPVVVRIVGAGRVLFGSDFPLLRQGACLRKARAAGLGADELELVLGGNAARLLSRPADPPPGG